MASEPAKKEPAPNVQPIKPKKKGKLLWIVVAVVATLALPSMDSEVNNNNAGFLASSAPSQQAAALAAP